MALPTKEQWLEFDKAQKQKAIADALFLLDFIYKQANRIYKHTHSEGEIPNNKRMLKTFLTNTYLWEKELETLSKNNNED
jgi:hypothetical protein